MVIVTTRNCPPNPHHCSQHSLLLHLCPDRLPIGNAINVDRYTASVQYSKEASKEVNFLAMPGGRNLIDASRRIQQYTVLQVSSIHDTAPTQNAPTTRSHRICRRHVAVAMSFLEIRLGSVWPDHGGDDGSAEI
jgi:hypothetical protein